MGRYANEDVPARIPPKNMGAIPVIARLVDPHGDEYWPAVARKWTKTHVWVTFGEDDSAWLAAVDVYRVLRPGHIEAAKWRDPTRDYGPPTRPGYS